MCLLKLTPWGPVCNSGWWRMSLAFSHPTHMDHYGSSLTNRWVFSIPPPKDQCVTLGGGEYISHPDTLPTWTIMDQSQKQICLLNPTPWGPVCNSTCVALNSQNLCCIVAILLATSPNKAQGDPTWSSVELYCPFLCCKVSILLATSPNTARWDPMLTFVALNSPGLCCLVSILPAPLPNKAQWDPTWTSVAFNSPRLCCLVSICPATSPNKAHWVPIWTLTMTLRGYRLKKNLSHMTCTCVTALFKAF